MYRRHIKRSHGLAFFDNMPAVTADRNDFDEAQQMPEPDTYRTPFVPGEWPSELDLSIHGRDCLHETAPATRASSILTTFGKWAVTIAYTTFVQLPLHIAQRFVRRQQIVVQTITREDGARKKRIIDAGHAHDPSTPSVRMRARAIAARRFPNIHVVHTPSPYTHSGPALEQPQQGLDADRPADLFPSAVQMSDEVRALGAPTMYTFEPDPEEELDIGPSTDDDMESVDDSLDFSWSDVLTGTPPLDRVTDQPLQSEPAREPNASPTRAAQTSPSYYKNLPKGLLVPCPVDAAKKFSPNTHRRIIHGAPVTPMRKRLVKLQLGLINSSAEYSPPSEPANHTKPTTQTSAAEEFPRQPSELEQEAYEAHRRSTVAYAMNEQHIEEAKAQEQSMAEARAAELALLQAQFNFCETVDNDLSFLSDAPSLTGDAPVARNKKTVRWAQHAGARPFYCDERICDMMDSTLELITSSPVKLPAHYDSSEEEVSEDEKASPSTGTPDENASGDPSQQPTESVGFTGVPDDTWDASDDSLEESQLSIELIQELQDKLAITLPTPTPTPPPPPAPVRALVTPVTEDEQRAIDDVAVKSEQGKIRDYSIVPYKIQAHDFSTLLPYQFTGDPRAWLNDNIINEYLTIVVDHKKKEAGFVRKRGGPAPPIHVFSSFFFTSLKARNHDKPVEEYKCGVENWATKANLGGKQYFDADLILYPICITGHWRLLVVKPKERVIEYLDSLNYVSAQIIQNFRDYLQSELKGDYIADEWQFIKKQRSTQQINGSDCGVFTLLNALAILRGEEANRVLACDGMLDARKRIAATLMKGSPTTEYE